MKEKNNKRPSSIHFPYDPPESASSRRDYDLAESEMNDVMISCQKLMDALQLDTIVRQNMAYNGGNAPSEKEHSH